MYVDLKKLLKNKNNLDFLWWNIHLLDKFSEKEALTILKEINVLLNKYNDQKLLYWFLRFLKDNNPFVLSNKVKGEIKEMINNAYSLKIKRMVKSQKINFGKYMIMEPLKIINKYW